MLSPPPVLLLVLLLLYGEPRRAGGYLRPPRGPFLGPQAMPHMRPTRKVRAFTSGSISCSCKASNSSPSSDDADSECPRCVWLRTGEDTSPVVVSGDRSIGVSSFEEQDVRPRLQLELTEVNAAEAGATVAPGIDASPAVEVVPIEVGIAPEMKRALGLFRGSHKRHIFLPVCLLGQFQGTKGEDALKEEATQAGSFCCGQGMQTTRRPLQGQEPPLLSRAAAEGLPPQGMLESLKEAVCKALKLGEGFCREIPLQLVAQVSAPKTKCRSALQLDSPSSVQLAAQTPTNDDLESVNRNLPALFPLASEDDALRILRDHYGPLLEQYRRLPHCPACLLSNSMASDSINRKREFKGNAALRILRLPRGPRLSLHLQLEPPLPSVPFSNGGALQDFPSPPPLVAAKSDDFRESNTSTVCSPYQLVSLYKFFPVSSPRALAELLRALWGPRGVLGRAYVAKEGLNAQLAVPSIAMPDLLGELQQIPGLEDGMQVTPDCLVAFEEYWRSPPFDALHIRPRHQVLRDGFAVPLDWANCGQEVSPSEWHRKITDMLQQQQQKQPVKTMVLLDMRNASEYAVGHFKGARCIDTPTFADSFTRGGPLEKALQQAGVELPSRNAIPSLSSSSGSGEDVEILMYCTGGIRCVKAGAFLKQVLGFPRVTRLKGGILAYKNYIQSIEGTFAEGSRSFFAGGENMLPTGAYDLRKDDADKCGTARTGRQPQTAAKRADLAAKEMHACTCKSLFVGSNYVFDHRMCQPITPDLLAQCILCGGPSGRLSNCSNRQCGRRVVLCSSCCASLGVYCSSACAQRGAQDSDKDIHAQIQRRMQARHTHKRLQQQRGLWAIRAQQLLAALKHKAVFEPPDDASPFARNLETEKALHQGGRALAQEAIPQDLWKWAHHVASAASSPSALQEALLEEGRKTAENLAGTAKEVPPFWSGHLHSRILSSISRLKRPSSILEIGSFVGISSLALAEGLSCEERVPGTCVGLVAIERDPRAAAAARRLISSSPWGHLITVVEADALQWLRSQPRATRNTSSGKVASEGTALGTVSLEGGMLPDGGFDLIYLDAEKKKYSQYIETILDPQRPLLAPRGALLIDNTLWGRGHEGTRPLWWKGTGAEKDAPQARRYASIAESMKNLREALRNDTRISHVLLPVGDGLSIVTWATPASSLP